MTEYGRALESELVRAGRERRRRRARLGVFARLLPSAGAGGGNALFGLLAAGSAAVVVAVVVIALAAHGGSGGTTAASGGGPGASALVAKLAVLRRPQTAADRTVPKIFVAPPAPGRRVPSLTRLVATQPGVKVFMVVNRPATGTPAGGAPLWSPRLGDQVSIVAVTSGNAPPVQSPGVPAADLADSADRAIPIRAGEAVGRPTATLEIVPDGVARVRLQYTASDGRPLSTSYPAIANNIVIVPLPSRFRGLRTTWYAADGRVIPSSGSALRHAMARQGAEHARLVKRYEQTPHSASPALLRDFAIFGGSGFGRATGRPGGGATSRFLVAQPGVASLPLLILAMADPISSLDLSETRSITTLSGVRVWVTPGADAACIDTASSPPGRSGSGPAGGCLRNAAAVEQQGLWIETQLHNGTNVLVGIVPNTNKTIAATIRGGAMRTIPVVDGVVITPAAGVTALHFRTAAGKPTLLPENGH
jgi:hypothetical protein